MNEHSRDLLLALIAGLLGVVFVLLMSCTTYKPMSDTHQVDLPEQTVFIFPKDTLDFAGQAILYIDGTRHVWVEGIMVDGKIVPNSRVLGHEVIHQMQWIDDRIACPDNYEWWR